MVASGILVVGLLLGPAAAPPRWVPPVPGPLRVLRTFDPPAVRWAAGHRGVDLAAAPGAAILAAGAGRISYAGLLAGRGVVVVVHGELRTTYEPVIATVRVDQHVLAGEPIGFLSVGHDLARTSAGVLHWGLLRGRTYLDPLARLELPQPVRLLPRWDGAVTPGHGADRPAGIARTRKSPVLPVPAGRRRAPIGGALAVSAVAITALALRRSAHNDASG